MKLYSPVLLTALLVTPVFSIAEAQETTLEAPGPNSPDEPLARQMSVAKAVDFIDRASLHWQRSRECVTCHTNGAYLMARGQLQADTAPHISVRKFFEQYVDGWAKKKPESQGIVVTAAALAMDDATSGKLTDTTRAAFDEAWKIQRDDGSWDWLKCGWGPFESDDHYGVTLAAIAASKAPGNYCLLYTSPSPRDATLSRIPASG